MVNKLFFDLKKIDVVVKLYAGNFIKISRLEIIRLGLIKKIYI